MGTVTTTHILLFLLLGLLYTPACRSNALPVVDEDVVEFHLNLEFLECEFFLWGALGKGLDEVAPELVQGGRPPIGARQANLDYFTRDIITQFAYQEVGHVRAIKKRVRGFPRPQLDLSRHNFAKIMDSAFGRQLEPPFDAYANSLNYLIASYIVPYVGLTSYEGGNAHLKNPRSNRLLGGLGGVVAQQDAVIRTLLYQQAEAEVHPYNITVAEFTTRISELRDKLGGEGLKDEGVVVPASQGAEGETQGNVIAADGLSLTYGRSPAATLRILYASGSEREPGGFFPEGADGRVATSYLRGGSGEDEHVC